MKVRRLLLTAIGLAAGYVVYAHGLWEPLRSVVIMSLGTTVGLGALLAHRRTAQLRPADTGYVEIALMAAAIVSWQGATLLPALSSLFVGGSAAALGAAAASRWHVWRGARRLERADPPHTGSVSAVRASSDR